MPLATGVQILTCIGRLDMLANGFEFGGGGGAVGGLGCVIQHCLLLTCPEGLTIFYTNCTPLSRPRTYWTTHTAYTFGMSKERRRKFKHY